MRFHVVLCIFVIITYASAASVSGSDGSTRGTRRLYKRAADPGADPAAYADAYADAYAGAFANAVANAFAKVVDLSNADPIPNAASNAVALSNDESIPNDDTDDGDDDLVRSRRFTCDVLSFTTAWFSFNDTACAFKCFLLEGNNGQCEDGTCVCK
ncbi:uncharacterized protein LOC144474952 [Augochlora pura]